MDEVEKQRRELADATALEVPGADGLVHIERSQDPEPDLGAAPEAAPEAGAVASDPVASQPSADDPAAEEPPAEAAAAVPAPPDELASPRPAPADEAASPPPAPHEQVASSPPAPPDEVASPPPAPPGAGDPHATAPLPAVPADTAAAAWRAERPAATETWVAPPGGVPPPPGATPGSAPPSLVPPPPVFAPAGDVTPSRRGRGRAVLITAAVVLAVLLVGVAGVAYATYDYGRDYEGRILPGATIGGVNVGGLDRDAAIAKVRAAIRPQLHREVTLSWEGETWSATAKELGARSDVRSLVDAALAASGEASFLRMARMRVLGDGLDFDRDVAIRYPRKGIKSFVATVASSFDRDARDATVDYSSGWVEIVEEREGRRVRVAPTVTAMREALASGTDAAELSVRTVRPEVTAAAFRQVLLLHIGENKLYLYEDGKIVREWMVATGSPDYMTPTGLYEVTEKRYMPTWVNPSPTGWGASMPASIPPGPGNPLGVRAINWSAPAIRFHGTSALYSLGYNASHGCVRLSNEDVVELYDLIDVGTPIVSVVYGSLRPLGSAPPPGPTAEQSADSAADAQAVETGDEGETRG